MEILIVVLIIVVLVFVVNKTAKQKPVQKSEPNRFKLVEIAPQPTFSYQSKPKQPERKALEYDYKEFPSLRRDICPYCDYVFDKTPARNRMCPSCKNQIIRASIPINSGMYDVVLLNEADGFRMRSMIEGYWDSIHNVGIANKKNLGDIDREIEAHLKKKEFYDANMAAWEAVILMKDILEESNNRSAMKKASIYARMSLRFTIMGHCDALGFAPQDTVVEFDVGNLRGCKHSAKGLVKVDADVVLREECDIPCKVCTAYDNDKFLCSPILTVK